MSVIAPETTESATASDRFLALANAMPVDRESLSGRLRLAARDTLAVTPFPTTRDERWRFTSIAPLGRLQFTLAEPASVGLDAIRSFVLEGVYARIVFINGTFAPGLSLIPSTGIRIESLAAVAAADPAFLEPLVGQLVAGEDFFTAMNASLLQDGFVIEVASDAAPSGPVHVLNVAVPVASVAVATMRNVIVVRRSAQVEIIESCVSHGEGAMLTSSVTEIIAEPNARVDYVKLQSENAASFQFSNLAARIEADAEVTVTSLSTGAAIARNEISLLLAGQGSSCVLNGLTLTRDSQLVDHHTLIDHQVPHCTSQEFFKGVLDGRSRAVFDGKIIVRKDAQKTSSGQVNRNLLLSKDAIADSIPQLEILADDVKCTHGSTIGQLDQAALFYLRARGIGLAEAKGILTYAFASEVLERVRFAPLRLEMEKVLLERLSAAGQETS